MRPALANIVHRLEQGERNYPKDWEQNCRALLPLEIEFAAAQLAGASGDEVELLTPRASASPCDLYWAAGNKDSAWGIYLDPTMGAGWRVYAVRKQGDDNPENWVVAP